MDARPCKQEWNSRRFLPQGSFRPVTLFPEVKAVIAPKDNDGVLRVRTASQGLQEDTDAVVNEGDARQVSVSQASLLAVSEYLVVSGSCRVVVDGEKVVRKIIEVRRRDPRQRE